MLAGRLYDLRRRLFGRYAIDDPRPVAAEAPYTYHLPSENELLALAPGDLAKVIVRSLPPGREWEAERLWVTITAIDGDRMAGDLANEPTDMPQLRHGRPIVFDRDRVIDIEWADDRAVRPPPSPRRRWYWERCLVDRCVTEDGVAVEYLYRDEPDMTGEGDPYPDSGWRIRGDSRHVDDRAMEDRAVEYVALGRVLNTDDSWLHLIDEPVGSAFLRDWTTGTYDREG